MDVARRVRLHPVLLSRRKHLDLGAAQLQDVSGRKATGIAFAALVAAAACLFWTELRVAEYGDLYWQIPEGLKILAGSFPRDVPYAIAAGPWVDHEWLFEAFVAWCYAHGAYGVFAGLFAAAYAAFPVALYWLLRRSGVSELAAGVVAALEIGALPSTSAYRPQTIGLYCFAFTLFELGRERPRLLVLALVEVLWANLHASALLGPFLGALALAGAAIDRVTLARIRALAAALAVVVVATLITPHGVGLWRYAIGTLSGAPFLPYVDEWRPMSFADPDAWLVLVPLIGLYALVPRDGRARAFDLATFAAFAFFAVDHRRGVAFLVPAAAPLIARQIDAARLHFAGISQRARRWTLALGRVAAAISLALALVLGVRRLGAGNALLGLRAAPVGQLARGTNISGRAYVWRPLAAYVPFSGYRVQLLVDSHADPYDAQTWHDTNALETLGSDYREVLDRDALHEVVMPASRPLARVLPLLSNWRSAGAAGDLQAFVRR